MNKKILLGTELFDEFISGNGYYVDKTELIYELVEEAANKVTLFTRPRRFGKTLTMSMMECFFSIQKGDSRALFEGKNIMRHSDFCNTWMNKYPTLFLSLKDVNGLSFESAFKMLRTAISNLCTKNIFLENHEKVIPADKEKFRKLLYEEATLEEIKNALTVIMRMMMSVYGKPVILLIDEYDVPLDKAQANGYYQEMLDVIRGMLSTSLKTNEFLKFAVITGCLRIPKESIFTGVNNFAAYSVLDEEFSSYFGFTQEEITDLLKYYHLEDKVDVVKDWYDGYLFGNTEIYCPWDAMSYVSALKMRKKAKPKAYWENTSGNDAFKAFFELASDSINEQFEALLNGKTITENVTNALTYEEAYKSEENLWSILLMTGYVTVANQEDLEDQDDEDGSVGIELRIPNREIVQIFQKAVVEHFKQSVDQNRVSELMNSLWDGDEEKASEILSDLLFETISYWDYHEDYYHAFLAGIFAGRGYVPKSNKERGLGRPDVSLKDYKNRRAMIIETKKSDSKDKLDYWCDIGIQQIVDKEYAKNLKDYKQVLCYGIAFFEKTAKVKMLK